MSYNKVKSRISWNYDSVNSGRQKLIKFNVRGKTLYLYLALNPDDYADSKYKVERASAQKYASVPCLYKIKNDKRAKYALDLIATLAEKYGLTKGEDQNENYYLPYETTEALLKKDLIRELVSKEKLDDFELKQKQQELHEKMRETVAASEVDSILEDEVAVALIIKKSEAVVAAKKEKAIINIDTISDNFEANETVNLESLKAKKMITQKTNYIKVLARGNLNKPLTVEANEFSIEAVKMILLTGGEAIKITR